MPIAPASTKNWEVLTMPDITDLAMSFVAMITNSSANASSDTYLWFERSYPLEENVQDLARENKVTFYLEVVKILKPMAKMSRVGVAGKVMFSLSLGYLDIITDLSGCKMMQY